MKETNRRGHRIGQKDIDEMMEEAILVAIRVVLSPENLEKTIKLIIDKIRGRVK